MNKKKLTALSNKMKATQTVLDRLKKVSNTLNDEALAEAQAVIAEKEAELENLKIAIEEMQNAEEDKSVELLAKLTELQSKVAEIENDVKSPVKNVKIHNYINSEKALKDFADAVKNSRDSAEFLENYKAVLVKNDITPKNTFLPPAVISEIKDAWESNAGEFLQLLNHTGLKVWKAALETGTVSAETSRAKAWTKRGETKGTANSGAKDEQTLTFVPVEIRPQVIYKYITIDRETILEDENGILVQYVSRELAQRILQEVMQAILVGDGRGDVHKKIRNFETVARAASDNFVTVVTSNYLYPTIEDVANAIDSIETEGKKALVVGKVLLRKWLKEKYGFGGTISYKTRQALADILGVDYIFDSKSLTITPTKNQYAAVVLDVEAYKVVGSLAMDTFEDFTLSKNANEFLAEIYAGGGFADFKAGAVVRCGENQDVDGGITVDNLTVECDMSGVITELQGLAGDINRIADATESIDTKTKDENGTEGT